MSICPCLDIVDVVGEYRRLVEVFRHVLPMINWKSRYRQDRQWHIYRWKVVEGHPYISWRLQVHWLSRKAWLTIQTIFPWFEIHFPYIGGLDQNLMIFQIEVEFCKELITFQIDDEFINPWKRVYVLHWNFFESLVVDLHVPSPIFLWN